MLPAFFDIPTGRPAISPTLQSQLGPENGHRGYRIASPKKRRDSRTGATLLVLACWPCSARRRRP
jgi:hypothetical protein